MLSLLSATRSDCFRFDTVITSHLFGNLIGPPDAVDDMDQGLGRRFDDIGSQPHAVEFTALVFGDDIDLAEGVFAFPLAGEGVLVDAQVNATDAVDALIDRIHWTVASGRFADQILAHLQLDRGGGEHRTAALHAEVFQLEMLWLLVDLAEEGERLEVVIEYLPLLVGQGQELAVEVVEVVACLLYTSPSPRDS